MILSLHDFLKKDVQKMVDALKDGQPGNLHPLIMREVEKHLIQIVLKETNYNFFRTARMLGISRGTLYRKIKLLNTNEGMYKEDLSPHAYQVIPIRSRL
jgi:DNA-binding protein Fis